MSRSLWTHFKLQIAFVATAGMLLSGCATTGSSMLDNSASPDPRLTQSNDAEFFSKSGYQACAVGAGIGILGCALSNSSNKAVCAIAAGITACGVAMGANYYLDQRRSEYADTTTRLAKMNSDVEQDTQNVITRTATAKQVIQDDQARIAQIKRDIANKKVDKTKAQAQIAEIDSNIARLRKDLGNMRTKVHQGGRCRARAGQQPRDQAGGHEHPENERESRRPAKGSRRSVQPTFRDHPGLST